MQPSRYKLLFENMLSGAVYCQMIYHEHLAIDFVILDVNPAFVRMLQINNAVGKRLTDLFP